ncbi:leucine-rich repeat domain-containing protein [Parapedobacter sp. 2B3]|uniref:leucine-rich repeat domain-containing protein n=1 Tax=Parapedobacter sp. 2B3 TaxID=3342381 RepID=UPI000FB15A22|nr:MAG: leucine-rich repeat domain-containing protein [Parapedobacter sp.]
MKKLTIAWMKLFMLLSVATAQAGLPGQQKKGITLKDLVAQHPIEVYTVQEGAEIPLKTYDQTNNFKVGVNVLPLSGNDLTDIIGISTLVVRYQGKDVPITAVPNLQIFLNKNRISIVPDEISDLGNVTFFYFNDNKIKNIPAAFGLIEGLQGVYFTRNRIDKISPEIFSVKKLRKFEIKQNRVSRIPNEIGNSRHIIHLNLANNPIKVLPESIMNLSNLRICDFSYCGLSALPIGFAKNKIRYQLRLIGNSELTSLPAGRGFETMTGTIDITGTGIDENTLPESVRKRISTKRTPSPNKLVNVIKTS